MKTAELHRHIDGSLQVTNLYRTLTIRGKAKEDYEEFLHRYEKIDRETLESVLSKFGETVSAMQTFQELRDAVCNIYNDCVNENTDLIELRFAPHLHTKETLSIDQVVSIVTSCMRLENPGIKTGLILCADRGLDSGHSSSIAALGVNFKNAGVIGFDLACNENGNPPSKHSAAFEISKKGGLSITCHAGEVPGSAKNVIEAVCLGATRIGHGYEFIKLYSVTEIEDLGVCFELCPSSSFHTGINTSKDLFDIFRKLLDTNIPFVINTDNTLIHNTSIHRELERSVAYAHTADILKISYDNAHKWTFIKE